MTVQPRGSESTVVKVALGARAYDIVIGRGGLGSLGVRRRRLWLRITPSAEPADGSPTVVAVGGLARSDSGNFATEFAALLGRLRGAATPTHDERAQRASQPA